MQGSRNAKVIAPGVLNSEAHFKRRHWFVQVPTGLTLEDLMNPAAWKHATSFGQGDLVEVVADDGSFDAQLRVVASGQGFCVMRQLFAWKREDDAAFVDADETAGIALGGTRFLPDRGWVAFDGDGTELGEFVTPGEAEEAAKAAGGKAASGVAGKKAASGGRKKKETAQ